jgi:predicted acylesterase/phospholipase RssA
MYGAYQAGAWEVLADAFQPDLVVGASIGAVNGWAIAGGCASGALIDRWLTLEEAGRYRWQKPRHVFSGILDSEPMQRAIQELHQSFWPKTEFAMIATDLLKLRPRIFRAEEVTWRHLAASVAIVGIFDQVRIEGRVYSDGGLLSALPVWAAAELGAAKIVALNVLPEAPGVVAKTFVRAMRLMSPFKPAVALDVNVFTLAPEKLLGKPTEAIYWKKDNAERWVDQGRQDAASALDRLREWVSG